MNNGPVAYVYQNFGIGRVAWLTEVPPDGTELYTHPVKELTDSEILEICDLGEWQYMYDRANMDRKPYAYAYCPQNSHKWRLDFDKPERYWKVVPLYTNPEPKECE